MGNTDHERGHPTHLLSEEDGVVYVEYVSITLLIGIIVSAALILVGVPLLNNFQNTQLFLISPVP